MKQFLILLFFIANISLAAEAPILSIRALPSMKRVGTIEKTECNNQLSTIKGEIKVLKFKCLISGDEKFFTFYDNGKEFITIRGQLKNSGEFKNSATVKYLNTLIELKF